MLQQLSAVINRSVDDTSEQTQVLENSEQSGVIFNSIMVVKWLQNHFAIFY